MESPSPHKKTFLKNSLVVIGVVMVIVLLSNTGNNNSGGTQSSGSAGSNRSGTTAQKISNQTDITQSDTGGEISIIARYGLDTAVTNTTAQDAARLYSLESSDKYRAVMQQAGVGSLNNIADTLAHLMKAWNVSDADASHSDDAIFGSLTQSTFTWDELTRTLIANGPKMNGYTSLADASVELAALQKNLDTTQSAISVFNVVGDALANPNSKLNLTLGGPGYIRTVVKQGGNNGIINAMEKISATVQAQQ